MRVWGNTKQRNEPNWCNSNIVSEDKEILGREYDKP